MRSSSFLIKKWGSVVDRLTGEHCLPVQREKAPYKRRQRIRLSFRFCNFDIKLHVSSSDKIPTFNLTFLDRMQKHRIQHFKDP